MYIMRLLNFTILVYDTSKIGSHICATYYRNQWGSEKGMDQVGGNLSWYWIKLANLSMKNVLETFTNIRCLLLLALKPIIRGKFCDLVL